MIRVKDKTFRLLIPEIGIQQHIKRIAAELKKNFGRKNPLFIGVLNGSFMFMADLMKEVDFPCEMTFIKCASYHGTESTGKVIDTIGLDKDIRGRHVIIVEDIVDTGYTMMHLIEQLRAAQPASLKLAVFTLKPESLKCDLSIDYLGMKVPNLFLVGYGMDYDGYGRNYPDIYVLSNENE